MKNQKIILLSSMLLIAATTSAQQLVYDHEHLGAVTENTAMRTMAELTHQQYLERINGNLQTINLNTGSLLLAQNIIYNSLLNVNSALKNGLAVRALSSTMTEIQHYTRQMLAMAVQEPYLLLFAEQTSRDTQIRAARLIADISDVVLNGTNFLADFHSRDQLIRHVSQELQIISSLVYGAWKAMFWANQRGLFRSLNPFSNYLNADRSLVEEIIRNAKYLNK